MLTALQAAAKWGCSKALMLRWLAQGRVRGARRDKMTGDWRVPDRISVDGYRAKHPNGYKRQETP